MRIPSTSTFLPRGRDLVKAEASRTPAPGSEKSAKTNSFDGSRTAPSGLERVLARLQSLPEPTAGQRNATDRISRNLARYAETQALGTTPAAAANNTPPVADTAQVAAAETTATDSSLQQPDLNQPSTV